MAKKKNKKIDFRVFALISLMIFEGCMENTGTLTILNSTPDTLKVTFKKRVTNLLPEQHLTEKGLKAGRYRIRPHSADPFEINVHGKKTMLVDLGDNNCFAVADYTDQYGESGGGKVKVLEKFAKKGSFTTSDKLTAELGENLPLSVQEKRSVTRLHRIDCNWIENDQAIIDAISNLP